MATYKVKLPQFEGPLDLLLHLLRQHELDIFDIPIAFIAKEYAAYIDLMKSLNLEVAGEFLVMAATLMQLKSRMLLPRH
ncbi:MAG: segregation/condensation protein A, partial [Candidatus Methylomirabilis sp.]|nr:segregation/condensation protein A [Deltaproteobacteria bacterium]